MEELPRQTQDWGEATAGDIQVLTIIGQIEGHSILPSDVKTTKYEHLMPLLASVEESPEVHGLLVLLNTVGGDIEAGLGLAELIAGMRTPTASLVIGGGHSIGIPLAVSADRSFIVPSAAMTVHPVRLSGVVIGVPQTFSYFSRISDRITKFITAHSHIAPDVWNEYMNRVGELTQDVGTVLDGEEAVRCGLIDRLGGLADAVDYLHQRIREAP